MVRPNNAQGPQVARAVDQILHGADTGLPVFREARQIPFKLHRVRDKLAGHLRAVFEPFDLTDPQWRVLRTLSVVEEIDTMALAERAFLLGPSLSRILRDLVGRNLIQRRIDDADARRFHYALTQSGRDLVDAVLPRFQPIYEFIECEMGREDVAQLCLLLDRLTLALSSLSPSISAMNVETADGEPS